jgi:hypothetical protein
MRRWISGGYFPRPTMFGRQQGWRWGQIRRWMQATEFLQGLGITRLIPPDDDETVVEEDNASTGMDATGGHPRTPTGHLRTSGDIGPTSSSGNKKRG